MTIATDGARFPLQESNCSEQIVPAHSQVSSKIRIVHALHVGHTRAKFLYLDIDIKVLNCSSQIRDQCTQLVRDPVKRCLEMGGNRQRSSQFDTEKLY
jgi:hypothetical protein